VAVNPDYGNMHAMVADFEAHAITVRSDPRHSHASPAKTATEFKVLDRSSRACSASLFRIGKRPLPADHIGTVNARSRLLPIVCSAIRRGYWQINRERRSGRPG
jgi:hypothetical protein